MPEIDGGRYYDLGKSGYEAYRRRSGGKSLISGATLPEFSELKQEIKDAWAAAAFAVADRVEAQTRNYTADDVEMPNSVTFANGRTVRVAEKSIWGPDDGVFLEVI